LFYHEEKEHDTTKGTTRKGAKQAYQIGFEQANPKENENNLHLLTQNKRNARI